MRTCLPVIFVFILSVAVHAQSITGIVTDTNGAPIQQAEVSVTSGTRVIDSTRTGSDGRFSFATAVLRGTALNIKAAGFSGLTRSLDNYSSELLNIVLSPAVVGAAVTVTITRTETRLNQTPASVVVLGRETLETTAAQTIDDTLRQIAGFTLFRRSSSRTTNPTAQGANLRGISGSGASRASVLFDGLSLNDAFGGWTYWSRVPVVAIEQAEVLRGGASSLYGSGGLSGAVNLVPLRAEDEGPILNFRASAGSQDTYDGSLFTAFSKGGWGFDLAAETFQTGGYVPVAENERGLADTRANSRHNNGIFSIERRFGSARRSVSETRTAQPADHPVGRSGRHPSSNQEGSKTPNSPPVLGGVAPASGDGVVKNAEDRSSRQNLSGRIFLRGNLFAERRDNGTSLTYNKTYFRQAAGGVDLSNNRFGDFQFRIFLEVQVYDQTFSAVSADRNTETLSRLQRVPSQAAGGSLSWTKPIKRHIIFASLETREVRGFSDEVGYFAGRATSLSGSGGRERTFAFLAQDNWAVTDKLNLNFGLRVDRWKNFDAQLTTRTLATDAATVVNFSDRTETAVSPRAAAIYRMGQNASVYASYTRSFRAPTLNELYRGFRVGNVVTQANENLKAEYANTFEGGVNIAGLKRRLNIRGNAFLTNVSDPIVSITLAATPTLITRQRRNVGKTQTRGLELDAEFAPLSDLRLSASYLLVDSRVTEFPANPTLVGKFLPQVARQQLNFQINYRPPSRFSFGIQARISDAQFEDDLNTLRLRPFFTMDATAAYRVHEHLDIFAAAENVFNSRYDIGLTPNRTVAAPAFVRVGLRFRLGGK